MAELTQVGAFCPNRECADYGKRQSDQQSNIIHFGQTKGGRQRYQCTTCKRTFRFTETKVTDDLLSSAGTRGRDLGRPGATGRRESNQLVD